MKVLFFGKADDLHCSRAVQFLKRNCDVTEYLGRWRESFPEEARSWQGDYIVSYLSRWVIPESVCSSASKAAINFHPASPHYPGIGCNNFALYEDAKEYGVTCHFMASKVDTGEIVATLRFPVFETDDVGSLLDRTYDYQLALFYDVAARFISGTELTASGERWTRPPFTRKQFQEITVIRPDMDADEIARRIRATNYGNWKPFIEIAGRKFQLV